MSDTQDNERSQASNERGVGRTKADLSLWLMWKIEQYKAKRKEYYAREMIKTCIGYDGRISAYEEILQHVKDSERCD